MLADEERTTSETPGFVNVRENILHFPSLPVPLRVLTGTAIAQVLVSVLLLAFKDAKFAAIPVGTWQGQRLEIGWPFLFLGTFLLIAGWTYLLCGVLQSRWWITFPVLGLSTAALWDTITMPGTSPLAPLVALGLWVYCLSRKLFLRRLSLRFDLSIIGLLLTTLNLAIVLLALARWDSTLLLEYSLGITSQMIFLLALLVPMLVVAGVDLAEISAEAGAWVSEYLLDRVPLRTAVAGTFALAAVKAVLQLRAATHVGVLLGVSLAAALVLSGGMALLILALERRKQELKPPAFGLFLLLSYVLFLVVIVAILLVGKGSAATQAVADTGQRAIRADWTLAGVGAILIGGGGILAAWRRKRQFGAAFLFLLIYGVWVLLSVGNPVALLGSDNDPAAPVVTMSSLDVAITMAAVGGVIALAALHRLSRASLGFVVGVLLGVSLLEGLDSLYEHRLSATDLVTLSQVLLGLGLLAAGLIQTARHSKVARHRRLALLGFLLLVPFLLGTAGLIVGTITQKLPPGLQLPVDAAPALILAVGLSWDMLMSGGRFTNQDGERFPRHGRLLLYIGYISLAAAALLWTKMLQQVGEGFFDDSILPPYGIIVLGIPLLFFLWALAGHRLLAPAAPGKE